MTSSTENKWKWPLILSFIRIPLLLVGAAITYLLFILTDTAYTIPLLPGISTLYFTVINLICFYILYRVLKQEGSSIAQLIDFKGARLGKDILLGFLWIMVLYFPFVLAVMGTMWVMFEAEMFLHFEAVFAPGGYDIEMPYALMIVSAIVSATLFPLLNAPIEELLYRGYAQKRLAAVTKKWVAILIPTIGFSIQHIMLAGTLTGAIVYAVAFFFWGLGAAIIYEWHGRLLPIIIAHFMTNFLFGSIPLIFLLFFY
ncbi:CPBP family intramembrane glutamic endopeptidase [Bacillus horti]|uniref:Membrane protease YdiL (CAAX protease family) n=1 Tax=Caldalkalibacillus horti TaxID=77523 RepID=A0ABT9W1V1_9BACI|nr:type II CAAX endopeptidase family protein [Bacillus horti]MDQ0167230.1 membrane protease YdiL (CAAX protease family) [Bacillus horti]